MRALILIIGLLASTASTASAQEGASKEGATVPTRCPKDALCTPELSATRVVGGATYVVEVYGERIGAGMLRGTLTANKVVVRRNGMVVVDREIENLSGASLEDDVVVFMHRRWARIKVMTYCRGYLRTPGVASSLVPEGLCGARTFRLTLSRTRALFEVTHDR